MTNFKPIVVVTAILLGTSLHAAPVHAVQARAGSDFCSTIDAKVSKIIEAAANRRNTLENNVETRRSSLQETRKQWDAEIDTDRSSWDAKREENFTKLRARSKTEAQKLAVDSYVTSVKAAVANRRTAIDSARDAYHTVALTIILDRKAIIDTQVATFRSEALSAASKAKNSCTANPSDASAVRQQLVTDIADARSRLKKNLGVVGQISSLAVTRQQAIQTANDQFLERTKTAREILKGAFDDAKDI